MSPPNLNIDKSSPVLVTGATGYIAGVLIEQLLELGLTVHGTVRDATNTQRLQYLTALADQHPGSLKFSSADLLEPGSFEEAMKGCSVVFHTASPFSNNVKDAQTELVEPAVNGTRNVLHQATQTPSVKRVVFTSSTVAISADSSDHHKRGYISEDDWNTTSSLDYQPYALSKTQAEKTAWEIAKSQDQWTMVSVNPSFVMGPGVTHHKSSESAIFFKRIAGGELASGCPNFDFGVVDVRDVARGHILAAFGGEKLEGRRYMLCGHNSNVWEMAVALRLKYSDYPLPVRNLPFFLLWLVAPYVGLSRRFVWNNINHKINFDNSRSMEELGLEYRSLETTMQNMMQQFIELGVVSKK